MNTCAGFDAFKFIEDGGKLVSQSPIDSRIADHRYLLLQGTGAKIILLYYSYLSPQQYQSVDEIIEMVRPHISDISQRTFFRRRKDAIEALSSILWGYTSKDSLSLLEQFFPEN